MLDKIIGKFGGLQRMPFAPSAASQRGTKLVKEFDLKTILKQRFVFRVKFHCALIY